MPFRPFCGRWRSRSAWDARDVRDAERCRAMPWKSTATSGTGSTTTTAAEEMLGMLARCSRDAREDSFFACPLTVVGLLGQSSELICIFTTTEEMLARCSRDAREDSFFLVGGEGVSPLRRIQWDNPRSSFAYLRRSKLMSSFFFFFFIISFFFSSGKRDRQQVVRRRLEHTHGRFFFVFFFFSLSLAHFCCCCCC